jgi:carbonic anhydrase
MKNKLLLLGGAAILLYSTAMAGEHAHWTYGGNEGPEHWGDLSPEFKMCNKGMNQSPVDLTGMIKAQLSPLQVNYQPTTLDVVNNGHTIKADSSSGSTITLNNHSYKFIQVHFHTPSENHINGQSFPMEAHFVHADETGNLAVIGLMYKEGEANTSLAPIWDNMPAAVGNPEKPSGVTLDTNAMLPVNRDYYRFNGSLTTPPCSEGVLWLVLKEPVSASKEQIEKFHDTFHHDTNRPVQPLNARVVLE